MKRKQKVIRVNGPLLFLTCIVITAFLGMMMNNNVMLIGVGIIYIGDILERKL